MSLIKSLDRCAEGMTPAEIPWFMFAIMTSAFGMINTPIVAFLAAFGSADTFLAALAGAAGIQLGIFLICGIYAVAAPARRSTP